MKKKLRVISINFPFADGSVVHTPLDSDRALFDFDVVVIRPPEFSGPWHDLAIYEHLRSVMATKKRELDSLFLQGGVLVVFLDVPDFYRVETRRYGSSGSVIVDNYDFLDNRLAGCVRKGRGDQITYNTSAEPFVSVLKKSTIAWTAYITKVPPAPLDALKFFAHAGAGGALAGKMPYGEGHIIILPNIQHLEEDSKLLYEKGKAQLEPIVLRALDDLDFGTSPGEVIEGTIHEIDGRTSKGSSPGIVEVKGSKNQISQSEFSPFVTKILADSEVKKKYSKGILVGNGLCETEPGNRLGDSVFSPHVLDGAKRNSIALINSVELYWLCCVLLRGDPVDKNAVREAILTGNGYVDLKPFSGQSPF